MNRWPLYQSLTKQIAEQEETLEALKESRSLVLKGVLEAQNGNKIWTTPEGDLLICERNKTYFARAVTPKKDKT